MSGELRPGRSRYAVSRAKPPRDAPAGGGEDPQGRRRGDGWPGRASEPRISCARGTDVMGEGVGRVNAGEGEARTGPTGAQPPPPSQPCPPALASTRAFPRRGMRSSWRCPGRLREAPRRPPRKMALPGGPGPERRVKAQERWQTPTPLQKQRVGVPARSRQLRSLCSGDTGLGGRGCWFGKVVPASCARGNRSSGSLVSVSRCGAGPLRTAALAGEAK